jgi:hypothetical protein
MARDRAEAIATETNVRTVETMLEALMRDLLDHGANALTLAAAQPGSRNAA